MTIEPQCALLQSSIEVECTCPNVGRTGVSHINLRQYEDSIALLCQRHSSCESTTRGRASVILIVDDSRTIGLIAIGALYPRRNVECCHIRICTIGNGHLRVIGLAHNDVLTLVGRRDSASVLDFRATRHRIWGRCHRDAFHLAKEETRVRWLVIAHALPNHCIAILMVVPECRDAIGGRDRRRVDADISIIRCTKNDFLTPVADNVTLSTWIVLRIVIEFAAIRLENTTTSSGPHYGLAFCARTVENALHEVARPIDTEIQMTPVETIVRSTRRWHTATRELLVGHRRDECGIDTSTHATREGVREITHQATTIVSSAL